VHVPPCRFHIGDQALFCGRFRLELRVAALPAPGAAVVTGLYYAAYAACAAAAALLVYRYDLYDREPWYLLLATALAGAVVMHLAGGLEDAAIAAIAAGNTSPYVPALIAASFEEASRLLVVVAVAVAVPRIFNDPMDGLVYGAMAGIGMALEETWAIGWQAGAASLSPVEIVRLSGHLTMGGITGFGVGLINRPGGARRRWILPLAVCVVGSILLHFLWDVAAVAQDLSGGLARWPALAGSGVMLAGMGVFGALVAAGATMSHDTMAPTTDITRWGWPLNRARRRAPRDPDHFDQAGVQAKDVVRSGSPGGL
jgi:RsiW-degrading membrane proteinase PrsW (M82 family)